MSMIQMSRVNPNTYKCDHCGNEGEWGDTWIWYGSLAHIEACPMDVPVACSKECMTEIKENINSGEWKLPKLRKARNGYHFVKHTDRIGY